MLDEPAIFWLDAHYSGDGTFGSENKCPLLDEIIAVNKSKFSNVLLIDDARAFLSPQTISHNPEEWPNIVEIFNLLSQVSNRYIIILEDVIFVVPEDMKNITARYAQSVNSINTLTNSGSREFIKKILRFAARKIIKH